MTKTLYVRAAYVATLEDVPAGHTQAEVLTIGGHALGWLRYYEEADVFPDYDYIQIRVAEATFTKPANLNITTVPGQPSAIQEWVAVEVPDGFVVPKFDSEGKAIITGTSGKDTIDASHAPKGQALPSSSDDAIFGLANRDKLSGLGGDDKLDGGKDKDTLFGGDGLDQFMFTSGLKQPADKVMDFVAADDTVLLAVKVFKTLAPGALSDTAFHDIGEAASADDRIIYTTSGKLLYDKNGGNNDDAHAFAKLIGAPDISVADFLAV